MQTRIHATTSTTPLTIANTLGVVAALVLLGVLTNLNLLIPVANDAAAFTALVIIGMSMCVIAGVSRAPSTLGWMHPATLSGAVLGVAILLLVVANTFGWTGVLDPVASAIGITVQRAAVFILALLIAVKWAIGLAFVR